MNASLAADSDGVRVLTEVEAVLQARCCDLWE